MEQEARGQGVKFAGLPGLPGCPPAWLPGCLSGCLPASLPGFGLNQAVTWREHGPCAEARNPKRKVAMKLDTTRKFALEAAISNVMPLEGRG